MDRISISRATLGRLPLYLQYLRSLSSDTTTISATAIAEALGLGEVQVRKDLNAACGNGKPKVGYITEELVSQIEVHLGFRNMDRGIIVGAGQLGTALLNHEGFSRFGLEILAAFDKKYISAEKTGSGKYLMPMDRLTDYCRLHEIHIGIITVPEDAAQEVCDLLVKSGIRAIWNFARTDLNVPKYVAIKNEDLALSLAHLNKRLNELKLSEETNGA